MSGALSPLNPEFQGGWRRMLLLVRRELWEHRELLWVPVVVCVLHLGLALAALVLPQHLHGNFEIVQVSDQSLSQDSSDPDHQPEPVRETRRVSWDELKLSDLFKLAEATPEARRGEFLRNLSLGHARVILLLGGLLLLFLFFRMLNREQQTRSSLFFQSMPLCAWEYLGGKLLTALLLGPILLWGTVILSHLSWLLVFSGAAWVQGYPAWELFWRPAQLPTGWGILAAQMVMDTLWFLPGIGWTLLSASLGLGARAGQRSGLMVGLVLFAAMIVDRLYLTGGGLREWLTNHILPTGFSWGTRALDSTARWLGEAPGTGSWVDLALGGLLGLLMIYAAVKALHWREER